MKPKKPKTVSKLKKELDALFSRYIRQKYANESGLVECFTCKCVKHWKEMQNGHYIPRSFSSTRYDEKNNHPQCPACNIFGGGKYDVYAVELEKKYGQGILQELAEKKKIRKQFKPYELEALISNYKERVE